MAKSTKAVVEELAAPIVGRMGYLYVDTEFAKQGKNHVLTLFIDKKGGVTLEDCEAVSRAVEAVLDEKDPITGSYCLCVSSPGLDRPLKNAADFERAIGTCVDVKLYKPFMGKKEFIGRLTAYGDDGITIETGDAAMGFDLKETAKISLHLDF
jgi:ribosome maturation factor RimP